MSAHDELVDIVYRGNYNNPLSPFIQPLEERSQDEIDRTRRTADAILAAGYRKPRTITTAAALEALPHGSAVQTSDESDTVVLKDGSTDFRNQSGYELSATDLWRYGTQPFTVIYEPTA